MKRQKMPRCVFVYMALLGLATLVSGCAQGPISIDEATEIRAEIGAIQNQLAEIRTDLNSIMQATEDRTIETKAERMRDTVAMMMGSLSQIEEELKPEEPGRPAGPAPPPGGVGGPPGGGGGGFQ